MATVALEALEKTYRGGVQAVKDVTLDIASGEFMVIVGPSGCGKSTLLRMVAGLEPISGGTLLIDGRKVNRLEPAERDIAMVFQNYALYPHMTVYGNMAYGLRNRGEARREIDRKVRDAAEKLGLLPYLERKPAELSGGQRQRVAMGRAIVREPKVFLFDEPLSNLDAKLRVQMRQEIKRLQRELGVTTLYVTHDQVEAMTLADRLVAMNAGAVEQIGKPMDLYGAPASLFVAGFIGSPAMNLLPCHVTDGAVWFGEAGLSRTELPKHSKLIAGIRPEHFVIRDVGETPIAGLVELVEELGSERLVHISVYTGREEHKLIARASAEQKVEEGQGVSLDAAFKNIHFFDRDGRRTEP